MTIDGLKIATPCGSFVYFQLHTIVWESTPFRRKTSLHVNWPHSRQIDTPKLTSLCKTRIRRSINRQLIIRRCQCKAIISYQIQHNQPHFHLRKVSSETTTRVVSKWREAARLWVLGSSRAAHVHELICTEVTVWFELIYVCTPKFRIAVSGPCGYLHHCALFEQHWFSSHSGHGVVKLQLSKCAVGD